jgi:hypothetical protein
MAGHEPMLGGLKLAAMTLDREAFLAKCERLLHRDAEDCLSRERSLAAFNLYKFLLKSADTADAGLVSLVSAHNRRLLTEHPAVQNRHLQDAERRNLLAVAARLAEAGDPARAAALLPLAAALAPESEQPYALAREILDKDPEAGFEEAMRLGFEPIGHSFTGRAPLPSLAECSDLLPVGGRLLCIGHGSPELKAFTLEGRQAAAVDLGLAQPISLFADTDRDQAWICDRGNARLVALDQDLTAARTVHLPSLGGADMTGWGPTWGGFHNGDIYLVCVHAGSLESGLFMLPGREGFTAARQVDLPSDVVPVQLVPGDGGLWTRDYRSNAVLHFNPATGAFRHSFTIASETPVSRFCRDGENLFATAYGALMKYGRDGCLVYTVHSAQDRAPFGHLVGCAATADGDRRLLFALDHNRTCLHILRIDRDAWRERLARTRSPEVSHAEQ